MSIIYHTSILGEGLLESFNLSGSHCYFEQYCRGLWGGEWMQVSGK